MNSPKHNFTVTVASRNEEIPPWRTCDVCGKAKDNPIHVPKEEVKHG